MALISDRGVALGFVLCMASCNVLADRAQGSGSEALPVDDRRSMDSSDSGTVTNPFPLLVLLVIVGFILLVVVVCSCAAFVCCIFCYCRNFRQSNDPAAHTNPDCEQGIQFGNPTYKEANVESEQNSTSSSDSLQNLPPRHKHARSSQSIVTHATPRIAVNRPSFSETNLTFQNRLALQLAFQVQLYPPDTFEFCNETRSLPRMPPSRNDQPHLPPDWLPNTTSAEGLSQAVVPSHVEPTAPTEKHCEETEV